MSKSTLTLRSSSKVEEMNDLALRQWQGQSSTLAIRYRVERIIQNLKDKGYGDVLSELTLPHEEYPKFLKKELNAK